MFTGIVTNIGKIEELKFTSKKDCSLKISTAKITKRKIEIGCSIACNGICLTLVKKETATQKNNFFFQVSEETCAKTNLKNWKIGQQINLEFSMRMGDEFGGHMVLGHVDGVAKIKDIKPVKGSYKFIFEVEKNLMKFITEKGSVTLNGVSLTVNDVIKNLFSVNIIPHTFENTGFQNLKIGDSINLEVDAMARYAARILQKNDK